MRTGNEVVIVKNGCRICGSGGALATAPLVQSKSYFEVKLQQSGQWSIGLATRKTDINKTKGGTDADSWCLTSDHTILHNNEVIYRIESDEINGINENEKIITTETVNESIPGMMTASAVPNEGDTIGVTYDHVELNFYLNGKNLDIPVLNVKGTVYPALYGKTFGYLFQSNDKKLIIFIFLSCAVDDGAILDIVLDDFNYGPPPGYDKIMLEQSLL